MIFQDGSVVVWSTADKKPTPLSNFSLFALVGNIPSDSENIVLVPNLMAKQIQSLSVDPSSNISKGFLILISTRGCDLLEVLCKAGSAPCLNRDNTLGGGILVRGHCNDELWGLATHPKYSEFCTVGRIRLLAFIE